MQIYGPAENKVLKIKSEKPAYWTLLIYRSKYSEVEIIQALNEIEAVNEKLCTFKSSAYDLLADEHGEMNSMTGFASDSHKELYEMLLAADYITPNLSENSHNNCFPVVKWNSEVSKLNNKIEKIKKFINKSGLA